jgi:hypothetical protein
MSSELPQATWRCLVANRAKAKGSAWETAAVAYFRENGFPHADRLTLSGAQDRGDIRLGDGVDVVVECKNHRSYSISEWLREAERERENASADIGVVLMHLTGKSKVEDAAVVMSPATFVDLLFQANYTPGGQR